MIRGKSGAGALVLVLGLAGCATTPLMPTAEQSYVERVEVVREKPMGTVNLAEDIRVKTLAEASKYNQAGKGKTLRVAVKDLSYKNAAMSMLVGSANAIRAHVVVVDNATSKVQTEFDVAVVDNAAINGVAGAIMAGMQNEVDVERKLATELAAQTLRQMYGSEVASVAQQRSARAVVASYHQPYEALRTPPEGQKLTMSQAPAGLEPEPAPVETAKPARKRSAAQTAPGAARGL